MFFCHQPLHDILTGDKPVDLAKNKSVGRAEKLNSSQANRTSIVSGGGDGGVGALVIVIVVVLRRIRIAQGGGDKKSDIVTRVHPHNLTSTDWPVKLVHLPTWMLYHQCCCINGLAIPHS